MPGYLMALAVDGALVLIVETRSGYIVSAAVPFRGASIAAKAD